MSRVVVLGSGVAGHTAAAFARRWLGKDDSVTVVSPTDHYNWIPSNIWVGVGLKKPQQVTFPLRPVYDRHGIEFVHAAASEIHPEGDGEDQTPFVVAVDKAATTTRVPYDYLINATGPKLHFDKTEGLGPRGQQRLGLHRRPRRPGRGGAGRVRRADAARRAADASWSASATGTCTCEGAAFEYIVNLEFELRARKVRELADITWITNEYELGDFGMGGMHINVRRLRHAEQHLQRIALRRARHRLDHPRPRREGRARPGLLRDPRRRRASRRSTSRCCCRRSPASA